MILLILLSSKIGRIILIYTPSQWETSIQQAFKSNVCNLIVLNHDDRIGLKSVGYFPAYVKVLSDKYYEDTKDILPGSSKSNKV